MDKDQLNITLIIKSCLEGHINAERRLFDLYYGYVKSICSRYGSSNEDTEEMLNDTFYNVFRYLHQYNVQFDFKPWLRKISINCCLSHLRKYKHFNNDVKLELIELPQINSAETELGEKYKMVIRALPPQYRAVFNLYVFEDYKHNEIAKELGISVGTSKSNLSRAKTKIVEFLKMQQDTPFHKYK